MQTYATSDLHDTAISVSFSANTSQFYTYGRNVTYQISLTATDSNGFQDSSSIGVQVRDPWVELRIIGTSVNMTGTKKSDMDKILDQIKVLADEVDHKVLNEL